MSSAAIELSPGSRSVGRETRRASSGRTRSCSTWRCQGSNACASIGSDQRRAD